MPAQLFADGRCDRYPAGFGQPFEPGSNIDAVAVNVIFLDDNIARIDADAQLQLAVAGGIIVGGQTALDIDGAIHRVDGAVELNEESVALAAEKSTLVQRDSWFDHGFDAIGKPDVCAFLVDAHQTAIADDIGEKDRGKLPFEVNAFHSSQLIFSAQSRHFSDSKYSGVKIAPRASLAMINWSLVHLGIPRSQSIVLRRLHIGISWTGSANACLTLFLLWCRRNSKIPQRE